MIQKRFSIKLKIFLSSLLLLAVACGGRTKAPTPYDPLASLQRTTLDSSQLPKPPWLVWRNSSEVKPVLQLGDDLALEGELYEALIRYQDLRTRTTSLSLKTELTIRELGTLLQLGQSQRVLEQSARFLKEQNYLIQNTPSGISLMVAYAYLHQNNIDQAIAWFSKAATASDPGPFSAQAKQAIKQLIRSIPNSTFSTHSQRWQTDALVGKLFVSERIRRSGGKPPAPKLSAQYFDPASYSRFLPAEVRFASESSKPRSSKFENANRPEVDSQSIASSLSHDVAKVQRKIGVLLPLSGQYAEHALKVKHGVILAIEQAGSPVEVQVLDTKGDPEIAKASYLELVNQGCAVILGPLLVKTTEHVAELTQQHRVPIISFTKRSGVPQLGPRVFRLGVTLENQVSELLSYSLSELDASSFAILYPDSASGEEYAYNFSAQVSRAGGRLVSSESYYPGDQTSIQQAVVRVSLARPDAIFIPDQLDFVLPLLDELEKSESADAVLLGPALWDDPVAIRGFGQLLDGAVFVTPFFRSSPLPQVTAFMQSYRRRFEHTPELLAAQSFDAANLAIAAIDRGIGAESVLSESLESLPESGGVTGRLKVGDSGEIYRRMSVLRLFKGEVIEVMAQGVSTGFVPGQTRASKHSNKPMVSFDSEKDRSEESLRRLSKQETKDVISSVKQNSRAANNASALPPARTQ